MGGLLAVGRTEAFHDVLDVLADGARRTDEDQGDLFVALTGQEPVGDVTFSCRQSDGAQLAGMGDVQFFDKIDVVAVAGRTGEKRSVRNPRALSVR